MPAAQPGVTLASKSSYGGDLELNAKLVRSKCTCPRSILIKGYEEIVENSQRGSEASSDLVLDARSHERYVLIGSS